MYKILLVDDQADIRRLMRVTLGKTFEILEAEDGDSALQLARSEAPAMVLLDVMMPGSMDGLSVLDAIRREPHLQDTRVIMVTARAGAKDIEEGVRRGADAYFTKPFSPLQLIACVQETLSKGDGRADPK